VCVALDLIVGRDVHCVAEYAVSSPDRFKMSELAVSFDGLELPQLGRVLINRDCSAIAGCRKRRVRVCVETLSDLLPPSPPAEKATARQDQAGQSSTDDGAGYGD
jgi:hypothetical protein